MRTAERCTTGRTQAHAGARQAGRAGGGGGGLAAVAAAPEATKLASTREQHLHHHYEPPEAIIARGLSPTKQAPRHS